MTVCLCLSAMEPLVSTRSPSVKVASLKEDRDDVKLPPLLSMVIEGLPPFAQSQYVHEAEEFFKQQNENRYADLPTWHYFCRQGLTFAGYSHPRVISLDRLVAMSTFYALAFLLDDIFFDTPDLLKDLIEPLGIDRTAYSSLEEMLVYLDHLLAVMGQQSQPSSTSLRSPGHSSSSNPAVLETMMYEVGRDILALSNPEWFQEFLHSVSEFCHVSAANHAEVVAAGHDIPENLSSCLQDFQSFTDMRIANSGSRFVVLLTEFASDCYISTDMRSTDPFVQKVKNATSVYVAFVNDVISYHKESRIEANPRNLITVLQMAEAGDAGFRKTSSSLNLVQATQQAIDLVNQYASAILDLEVEVDAAASSDSYSVLQRNWREIKALVAGTVYYNCMCERYRQPDSVFPELRHKSTSWEAFLEASRAVMGN